MIDPNRKPDDRPPVGLDASAGPGPGTELGRFEFRGSGRADERLLETDLPCLGGDLATEHWCTRGEVATGRDGNLAWAAGDDLLLASMALPEPEAGELSDLAQSAYGELIRFVRQRGFGHFVRLWNFIPRINEGSGDRERYRRFCLGRSAALEAAEILESGLCAGTAIGTRGDRLLIHALCARNPGVPVENPRQVAAYRYPRRYGPRSPSFARATALPLVDGDSGLLISGTASVVGHATMHPGDLTAQVDETVNNMQSLLEAAARRLNRPGLARFGPGSLLRVYLREGGHWPAVYRQLRRAWPDSPVVGLEGDICRADLLVEIEAWHRG